MRDSKENHYDETSTSTYDIEQAESPSERGNTFKRIIDGFKPAHDWEAEDSGSSNQSPKVKKVLSARHLNMLAIGGSIGSGLFIGSGTALSNGGPGGIVIAFAVIGTMLFAVMQCLGELAVRFPITGAFYVYADRFMDSSWAFALGWNYVFLWLVSLPLELTSASLVLDYWSTDNNGATNVNKAAWVALFWVVICCVNIFGVRGYGESEFVLAIIKVIAIIGFCIFGIVAAAGGIPNAPKHHAEYWETPFPNGFKGLSACFVTAAFSFSGSEMAGLAAAETDNPAKNLPRAVKQVFWRILLFYLVSLTLVAFLVPYNNPMFGKSKDGRSSPFVIAIRDANVKALPSIFNAVILVSALSVGNTAVYSSSRTMTALAYRGQAPKLLKYIDRRGCPLISVAVALTFGLLGFLVASKNQGEIFDWLLAFSGLAVILTFFSICWCFIRYRAGMRSQGVPLDVLSFKAAGGVLTGWYGAIICIVVLALQFWVALFPIGENPSPSAFFKVYLGLPIVIVMYFGHKVLYRCAFFIRAKDMDLRSTQSDQELDIQLKNSQDFRAQLRGRNMLIRLYYFWC